MKVIIGAGNTSFNGWISTNKEDLDLLEKESFKKFFHEKKRMHCLPNMFGSI